MARLSAAELRNFLDEMTDRYNRPGFIETDPVSIPHRYRNKEDIEIAGFLAATIAWGQRPVILKNASRLLGWMDDSPAAFVRGFSEQDLKPFRGFVHRTFHPDDCLYFLRALQRAYRENDGLQGLFTPAYPDAPLRDTINSARRRFFEEPGPARSHKHFSDPVKGSAAKRINMFLRWMVRHDERGVDFGIWKQLQPASLICPLDVHSARVGRKLGLLKRKSNDWQAAEELTAALRKLCPEDPVKYDYALFGLGVFERF